MVGKTRAWVRKKIGKLRRLYHKKGPTTYAEDASLILVLSLSERSPEPQPDLNRLENISSEVPQDAIPRALMRPYSGAYPSSYPSPRPESVAPTKRRLGRMQRSLGCNPPPEFQYMKDNSESEQRAVRQQASAMSANTIGWDTPIGNYAGGKQVLLHPTGLCELRRPESAARMQEMEQVADYDFRSIASGLKYAGAGAQEVHCDTPRRYPDRYPRAHKSCYTSLLMPTGIEDGPRLERTCPTEEAEA